ncbi:polysaccharide pyruvyl transferase family protein [Kineothrix sp. MSJ-39]|uniref:polysaccharide pyruvyl transferase family protein n=1 Tax=Kineothrix sp. MSJ-39 TaxID=2841533 RepID=UPI001C103DCC|nr:polysaccharide pyruvyl transferase family protein [Kineothrix sp. MSJ-39]MBU5428785.1 polysaccharide pyruvyl transferase family protein [Kineothrix sp. MSJ-39]
MKVCILSMQRVSNFGSVLQSYSLKKLIEENGDSVSFIDIEPNREDDLLMNNNKSDYRSETDVANNFVEKLKHVDKYFFNRIWNKIRAAKQEKEFQRFMNDELKLNKELIKEDYDWAVIGSDEVFNCMTSSPWGFTSQLFGNIKQAENIMTYAASCGTTTYEELPHPVKNKIKTSFEHIQHFSVRDKNTYSFVKKLTSKNIQYNLDPVLVGDFTKEMLACNFEPPNRRKYCIVYSYFNRIKDKNEINAIKKFCKEKRLEMVAIGAPQMWISKFWVLTPFEVLEAFRMAEFVITDTFHGTIFAAKYSARYAVMVRESNKNKLLDLIDRLDIRDHLISADNDLDQIYELKKTQKLEEILKEERKKTKTYLSYIV